MRSAGLEGAQVALDHARALAALVDRPDDERLPAARVARGEHPGDGGLVDARVDVAAPVLRHAGLVEELLLGVQEAHGQEHEVRLDLEVGARHRRERRLGALRARRGAS
jgi:hypothetical protein